MKQLVGLKHKRRCTYSSPNSMGYKQVKYFLQGLLFNYNYPPGVYGIAFMLRFIF